MGRSGLKDMRRREIKGGGQSTSYELMLGESKSEVRRMTNVIKKVRK